MLFSREDIQTGQNRLKSHTKRQTDRSGRMRTEKETRTVSQEDKETRRRMRRGGEGGDGGGGDGGGGGGGG